MTLIVDQPIAPAAEPQEFPERGHRMSSTERDAAAVAALENEADRLRRRIERLEEALGQVVAEHPAECACPLCEVLFANP